MTPSYRVEAPVKPLHAALVEPVPCSTFRLTLSARALVVLYEVPYSLTVEASEPVEVTLMHLVPVAPGLRLLAVNSAVSLSSSLSATVPAVQLLVGLTVVAEKAEDEAAHTMPPEARSAEGRGAAATRRFLLMCRSDISMILHVVGPSVRAGR